MKLKFTSSVWAFALFLPFASFQGVRSELHLNAIGIVTTPAATSDYFKTVPTILLRRSYNSGFPVMLHDKAPAKVSSKVPSKAMDDAKTTKPNLSNASTSSKSSKKKQKKRIAREIYDAKTHKTKETEAELIYVPEFTTVDFFSLFSKEDTSPKHDKKNQPSSSTSA